MSYAITHPFRRAARLRRADDFLRIRRRENFRSGFESFSGGAAPLRWGNADRSRLAHSRLCAKYGTWAGYPEAEWCAEFQCWCVNQVDRRHQTRLLNQVYPNYSGTNVGRDWFLNNGRYVSRIGTVPGWGSQWWKDSFQPIEKNSYIPQPGDWMFLTDNANGDTSHVAMVEYCALDENGKVQVHVIEGNNVTKPAPQGVERNAYALNYWRILGYGTVRDLADITLKFGSSGPKVVALQKELVQAGLLEERYTTGKYGAITTSCIQAVQRSAGIEQNGIANLETRMALKALIAQKSADAAGE